MRTRASDLDDRVVAFSVAPLKIEGDDADGLQLSQWKGQGGVRFLVWRTHLRHLDYFHAGWEHS